MIIVNLTGGLGNQMFQYAFGKKIALECKTSLKIHYTNALLNTQRSFELDVFNISANLATKEDLHRLGVFSNRIINRVLYLLDERFKFQVNRNILTQRYPYNFDINYLSIKDSSYIQGFWADERYFNGIESVLIEEFTPRKKLDRKNNEILKKIQTNKSVSVHVRRGDYITNKDRVLKFIGINYYKEAIKKIDRLVQNPSYFIFSDDIEWCRENFKDLKNRVYFIDYNKGKDAYKDMWLMSKCKHNIIANSTFSWWGAWLNQNKNKIIIKP